MISPFVRATGQTWKVWLGWGVIALGLGTLYACLSGRFAALPDDTFVLLVGSANVANATAFATMLATIRCPRCRLRLLWHALSAKAHPSGLAWFHRFEACPACGYAPSAVGAEPR